MDTFLKDHDISPTILQYINRVSCYVQVFSLAYIATGDGMRKKIMPWEFQETQVVVGTGMRSTLHRNISSTENRQWLC